MYPFIRMVKEMWKFRNAPALSILGTHRSSHICWPWDLDLWNELNNGRTLTLYDLGRLPLGRRTRLEKTLRDNRWGLTVAGSIPRYRRRVQMFARLDMVSRCIGWDQRFIYIEQSMWSGDDCTSQVIIRSAIVGKSGIVASAKVLAAMGEAVESPPLPDWVETWIAAENARPWPPAR